MAKRSLLFSQAYRADLRALRPYERATIQAAVDNNLVHDADVRSRNRRPLREPISICPEATWQIRIGGYRVLYRIDDDIVRVLRVSLKGTKTSEEMGP